MPTLITLESLRSGLLAVNADATQLCEGLTADDLRWSDHPTHWSIAANLVHLRVTTETFLPTVDRAIAELRQRNLRAEGPFKLGLYGRFLTRAVAPPPLLRSPAPKPLVPPTNVPPSDALPRFLESQQWMLARMDQAAGLDLAGPRFPSPLASFVKMNLLEFFGVFNGHSRRHIWQANNMRRLRKP